MATNPTSSGPFVWDGTDQPPENIEFGDKMLSTKINEIKDNADFLINNVEACFNEKINLYSDRDSARLDVRYNDQYASRRDTVNTLLNATNKDSQLSTVWSTAQTGLRTTAYSSAFLSVQYVDCDAHMGGWRSRARVPRYGTVYSGHYSGDGGICTGYHTTYHSGVDSNDNASNDTSKNLTFNSADDGTDYSARHNIFCSILT